MAVKADAGGLRSVDEAMAYLRVSRTTLYQLMSSGQLRFVKLGRCRRVSVSALADLIAQNTHTARPSKR